VVAVAVVGIRSVAIAPLAASGSQRIGGNRLTA
jgi:hypothetical protein